MTSTAQFRPGDLVSARDREWIVLPESNNDLLMLRPLGGLSEEEVGLIPELEPVSAARFEPPCLDDLGNHSSSRLLLQAARLSTRSSAGPFRSFGRIAVEPRPYQLVPLIMALRQSPCRLLIADDVGIGKTIESCLIAKELLERGEADGLAVLCPAHLAEQWQRELAEKFHIEAELVLPSTARRLERNRRGTESVFARHRFVIISTDYIKSARRIDDFVQHCPNLVLVDEAHSCSVGGGVGQARHYRHNLIQRLAQDPDRHLILVSATPHSGKEDTFRSLIGLLDPQFETDPEDLPEKDRKRLRAKLARHLVQRRRGDIASYLSQTEFPKVAELEVTYALDEKGLEALQEIVDFAAGLVEENEGAKPQQRVRWWSALALLRAFASSPAAAAATMRTRAKNIDAKTVKEVDDLGRRSVLDLEDEELEEASDLTPGSFLPEWIEGKTQKRLQALANQMEGLSGPKLDMKLAGLIKLLRPLIKAGNHPIVFCRFVDTAEYVANHLRKAFAKTEVCAVTGLLPPSERENRVHGMLKHESRILVSTDCLSEGVNLQEGFDTVVHYDLSWNPTRHEQREGRVDRFGQPRPEVRVLTYHGSNNLIDVVVLRVLHKKARNIRSSLGVSVSMPTSSSEVIEHLYEEVISRMKGQPVKQMLFDFDWEGRESLHTEWQARAEAASRSIFAQQTVKEEEVATELAAVQEAIGSGPDIARFFKRVLPQVQVPVIAKAGERLKVELTPEAPRSVRAALCHEEPFCARFKLPVDEKEIYLSRTHPMVEGLASWVMDTALDPAVRGGQPPLANRCGVSKCAGVSVRTNLLVLRVRFHLHARGGRDRAPLLAEEIISVAYTGEPSSPEWLSSEATQKLLDLEPSANIPPELARIQAENLLSSLGQLEPEFHRIAQERAVQQEEGAARLKAGANVGRRFDVKPILPVDILGAYVILKG